MSPELFTPGRLGQSGSHPTQPADMYALGMVIYEVLTGFDPFHDLNLGSLEIVLRVLAGRRPSKPINAEGIGFGSGTWELVQECWKKQPTKRPTIERVSRHLEGVSAFSRFVAPTGPLHPGIPHIRTQFPAFANLTLQIHEWFSGSGGTLPLVVPNP